VGWKDLDIRRLRHVPDPRWVKALAWAYLPFGILAVVLDASDLVWLGLFAVGIVLALVSLWARSRRSKERGP